MPIAASDLQTTTGANNDLIRQLGLDPATATPSEAKVQAAEPMETEEQLARLDLLTKAAGAARGRLLQGGGGGQGAQHTH